MTRRVLFLPQNDNHGRTTALLAAELRGYGVEPAWLNLEGVFHQPLGGLASAVPAIDSGLQTARPFYVCPPWQQAAVVLRALPRVGSWVAGFDQVVAFNDGALQRAVLAAAARQGSTTNLLIDAMITWPTQAPTIRTWLRDLLKRVGRLADRSYLSCLFPSDVGLFPVDRVFVPGIHSARCLSARGAKAGSIVVAGLPRSQHSPAPELPSCVRNVLYLTGAFRWHDLPDVAAAQLRDVKALAGLCRQLGINLTVRCHPRDDRRQYTDLDLHVSDPNEGMDSCIARHELVLSIVSTGLIDAILLGRPARMFATGAAWQAFRNAFAADPAFKPITSIVELSRELTAYVAAVDPRELARQRERLPTLVATTGQTAVQRIVLTLLQG